MAPAVASRVDASVALLSAFRRLVARSGDSAPYEPHDSAGDADRRSFDVTVETPMRAIPAPYQPVAAGTVGDAVVVHDDGSFAVTDRLDAGTSFTVTSDVPTWIYEELKRDDADYDDALVDDHDLCREGSALPEPGTDPGLEETHVATLARVERCSETEARRLLDAGEWTDDRRAALLFSEALEPSASERLAGWLRPETTFRRRVSAAVRELERLSGSLALLLDVHRSPP